ncbi:MAG: MBL fold metallo-hydrolase [Candidatus Phosphoribacter sp.]|nr:MBL fold metallo-hydrolase [Actinomycetales bacterium]
MATAMRVQMLPARLGDCLLVECLRPRQRPWRMLVDGGPSDTWPLLRARLELLPSDDQTIDVALVTHIDSDHIGGMIPFLASAFAREHVRDVWFNGRPHLPRPVDPPRSVAQGETLTASLGGVPGVSGVSGVPDGMPWNIATAGAAVWAGESIRADAGGFQELDISDGPRITVLSPDARRLGALAKTWWKALDEATHPRPDRGVPKPPQPLRDIEALAATKTTNDAAPPNGSSIALLLEHRGASLLLGADAFGTVLAPSLATLAAARGVDTVPVDAFKLPHHGSQANVTAELIALAPARHYLVSSNGDTFGHPDDPALARVVVGAPAQPTLWFNYRNERTSRWAQTALRTAYGYAVRFPTATRPEAGVAVSLPARRV